jgi:four helix bundle protein
MKEGAIKSYRDLKVFQLSYSSAMEVFNLTERFPREEIYSLTDQIRRASRSVSSNIVEGWAKREYENIFRRQLVDAVGSCEETKLWLKFALDCGYISPDDFKTQSDKWDEVGKMLHGLHDNWRTYR